jgi:GT2 family glycosyltransferase
LQPFSFAISVFEVLKVYAYRLEQSDQISSGPAPDDHGHADNLSLAVIIPTYGRRDLLPRTLSVLEQQIRLPDEVVISAPDEEHAAPYVSGRFPVSFVFGKQGLCAQRNQALEHVLDRHDIVTFFDDDFLPAQNYLANVERGFRNNSDWAVASGDAVHDGATGPGFEFDEGLELLEELADIGYMKLPLYAGLRDNVGAYGCNMSIRASLIGARRFDERLPLYGWQEDIDFTSRFRKLGRVVGLKSLYGVHLATKTGRQSGLRLGYSQIANPIYLARKGTMPAVFAARLMLRNVLANLARSVWPEPYIDRFGRLRGNALAASHILRGRIEPETILRL